MKMHECIDELAKLNTLNDKLLRWGQEIRRKQPGPELTREVVRYMRLGRQVDKRLRTVFGALQDAKIEARLKPGI